jgi:hypothetical protein
MCAAETGTSLVNSGWNADCASAGGVSGSGCPAAGRVGTCTNTVSNPVKTIVFYGPVFTEATGRAACSTLANSAWTPG